MIIEAFKEHIVLVIAIVETFSALPFLIWPDVGGWLYGLGGFYLPFVTVGVLLLGCVLMNLLFLPRQDEGVTNSRQKVTPFALLKESYILYQLVSVMVTSFAMSLVYSNYKDHMKSP